MKPNRALEAMQTRGVAYGSWTQMNCPEISELQARSGLDFVIVDMEHGSFGIESAVRMMTAIEAGGASSVVRVPEATPATILKVLDAGAAGIIIPNVETPEQVQAVVDASRYAPEGRRGACPCTRSTGHGVYDWNQSVQWARDNVMVIGLVETPLGIENFSKIIGVEGLSAVGVGQFDLSQAMGLAGDHEHPDVLRKQELLVGEAREKGVDIFAVCFASDPGEIETAIRRWRKLGSRFIAVSGDRFMLSAGYGRIAKTLSGLS